MNHESDDSSDSDSDCDSVLIASVNSLRTAQLKQSTIKKAPVMFDNLHAHVLVSVGYSSF